MDDPDSDFENRMAVLVNWSFWGGFGVCFLLSGFSEGLYLLGLVGFAALCAGFVSHLIINQVFGAGFRNGEVAAAVGAFGLAILGFVIAWIANPDLGRPQVWLGLTGAALGVAGIFAYLATRFGLKDSFSMFHMKARS
jgi:hypothetical protein